MKKTTPTSTHKKTVVVLFDGVPVQGYVNPQTLSGSDSIEIITREGEFQTLASAKVKRINFVRDFPASQEEERKAFYSRPKLDGLWVRLRFRDEDVMEGMITNELKELIIHGIRVTPPDLNGNTLWMFVPSSALNEIKVLGVVGVARRPALRAVSAPSAQPKLFEE